MKFFTILCLVVMAAATGYAIQCYNCSPCNDAKALTDSQLLNCTSSVTTCMKVTTNDISVRTCGSLLPAGKCERVSALGITAETCVCEGEKCNGAGALKSSIVIGSLISLVVARFVM